jgi:hypothetical protein
MKWADYCVTKLNKRDNGLIDCIILYEDLGESLSNTPKEQNRNWMVQMTLAGKSFCTIKRNEKGSWNKIGDFSFNGEIYSWQHIPENITKRKTFISYYHYEDQQYKERFKNLFDDLIIHKSVEDGEIDSDNTDGYIKQLIQKGYLEDTTVLIVLIGINTKDRKHIDWEISGALNYKVGEKYSGLLGLLLPNHSDFGTGKATYNLIPDRLADNFKADYAIIRDWTDDRVKMQEYIELAFERRSTHSENIDNTRIQMTENTNE